MAGIAFVLVAVGWIFGEHHVPTLEETYLFLQFACWALFVSGFLWLLYMSLEPSVRRRWRVIPSSVAPPSKIR